jgi:PAS domain S-box-containing protein
MSDPRPPIVLSVFASESRPQSIGQTLRTAGYQVQNAACGAEALALAMAETPDVILLDLELPDMTGFEVCCRLKAHADTAAIPVLHLSEGPIENEEFTGHLEQGDEAYLTHPVDDAVLVACVRTLLRTRQTQLQFSSFLETAPDAVVIADREGRIVRVNQQAERMFGYERQELVGREVELLMPQRFQDKHREQRAGFAVRPAARPMGAAQDLWARRKDGSEFPVEINLSPLPGPAGFMVASSIRDVTERKQLEHELLDADRRKNQFLAMLAHELRGPLAPVRSAAQAIRMIASEMPELLSAADVIQRQVHVMTRLVDDLLDVSRITSGKLHFRIERVELSAVVQVAAETCRPLMDGRGQRLSVQLPPQPLFLDADPMRLAQVFTNLLNNSAKYTEQGGQIWLCAEQQQNDVSISVKDTGVGIEGQMLSKVFDCFTQVDGARKMSQGGMGIGLSLVKGLVERHGGSVEAHSEGLGRGSEFIVRLPLLIESPLLCQATQAGG